MGGVRVITTSDVDWNPSAVVALAASPDASQVAAARSDGSLDLFLVSPGSVGWHCQLTIHGDSKSRVSSLVWCRPCSKQNPKGRLLSSSIDGSVSEWDLFALQQKVLLDSIGVSLWQMAEEPLTEPPSPQQCENVYHDNRSNGCGAEDDSGSDESNLDDDDDDRSLGLNALLDRNGSSRIAVACDDGCIRLYLVSGSNDLTYNRSFSRVSGRALSVTWSLDAKRIFSGSSDGYIRCWDVESTHEIYRITAGLGGVGTGSELCILSLLYLRCGTLVSGDSSGSVQFWDSHHGTLLQAHTDQSGHKGDVNALTTVPNHNHIVFSAGSDGQVALYKLCLNSGALGNEESSSNLIRKWECLGKKRIHTHDVKALTVAVPIYREGSLLKPRRYRSKIKPLTFSYHKWAHMGVPMLISGGDDTKLYAYFAKDILKYSPHDICPAPQKLPVHLMANISGKGTSTVLIECPNHLDIFSVPLKNVTTPKIQQIGRVKCASSSKIICSAVSSTQSLFAYSDHVRPKLFELKQKFENGQCTISERKLAKCLPFAHSMAFSSNPPCFILAGHDRKIYLVDVQNGEVLGILVPRRRDDEDAFPPSEPPITKLVTSIDGQWLAAINCFGDIYIFNLEIQRQHWFISRLHGASVAACSFTPQKKNVLVICTSSNQVYVFDVEAKQLGEWSKHNTVLPQRFQEFPGEVIGLAFPPSTSSSSAMIYSSRAVCFIDFSLPVVKDDGMMVALNVLSKKSVDPSISPTVMGKRKQFDKNYFNLRKENFDVVDFKQPVLFLSYLSQNSLLIIEKPWSEVVRKFEAPQHRHIYGT